MDANYFREKAESCRRQADDLRWNDPGRYYLMGLAEDFQKRAELAQQQPQDIQRRSTRPPQLAASKP
jgi:hypothetical protein